MKITLATDNRFWRLELGSHRRISALVNYLASSGNDLSVVFLGRFYEADRPGLASLPGTYRFMAPSGARPTLTTRRQPSALISHSSSL